MLSIGAKTTGAAKLRSKLHHPVVDADGHFIETVPVFEAFLEDYVKRSGGGDIIKRFREVGGIAYDDMVLRPWSKLSDNERRNIWMPRPPWWSLPAANTLDRATAHLPRLMYERLDDLGIDFAVLYPSRGLTTGAIIDDEVRQLACRAFNEYHADLYAEFCDRLTPVAMIPARTPSEAIVELEHAVTALGFKAIMIDGVQHRFIGTPGAEVKNKPRWGSGLQTRIDTLGLDSEYDYDPFWQRCIDLKVSPSTHTPGQGWGSRQSISNYMYNHIGSFAASMEASCKGLFMGGVTHRFPQLAFGMLEGGVGWACNLLADIVSHWEKRNISNVGQYNPARIDLDMMKQLISEYGGEKFTSLAASLEESFRKLEPEPPVLDEWEPCGISSKQDIYDRFIPSFYFGCEADDPMVAWAFNEKLNNGQKLKAMFSSDLGHWDVADMTEILEEAYELVEHQHINEDDFKEFVFDNPVKFYSNLNRDFFKGTRVEQEAQALQGTAA